MSETVFVGIDGGGTRARALVVDARGRELARRVGEAGIVRAEDPAAAATTLAELTHAVLIDAGRAAAEAVLCCALAGAGRATERDALRVALAVQHVAARIVIVGDAEALMADAFGAEPGVLLVAGTGSIAWARAVDGTQLRVGGWGLLLGDEGSGYAIGLAALIAMARAADGRADATVLSARVLQEIKLADAAELIGWGARATKAQVASLAPLVLACADEGDAVAAVIRDEAVDELVLLASTAARRAGATKVRIALAGGMIEPGGGLRDHVMTALRAAIPAATVSEAVVDGARGATLIARTATT